MKYEISHEITQSKYYLEILEVLNNLKYYNAYNGHFYSK